MRLALTPLIALAVAQMPSVAFAAACCGAGSAAPTVITGDDRAQVSLSLAQSKVIGDAPAAGIPVFRADDDDEATQTLRLDAALLLADRWQAGITLPFSRRSRQTSRLSTSASGVGDIALSGAYELLPEWDYSVWRPHGWLFVQTTLPTGGSVYDASLTTNQPWALDSRGRGFFSTGLGALFLKSWGGWDAVASGELHRGFARSFGELKISPGWGGSLVVGGGYSPGSLPLRVGLSLSPAYEGGLGVAGAVNSRSSSQLVWSTSAQLAWMPSRVTSLSAVYADQTLLGPASNVALSRSLALMLQHRWER